MIAAANDTFIFVKKASGTATPIATQHFTRRERSSARWEVKGICTSAAGPLPRLWFTFFLLRRLLGMERRRQMVFPGENHPFLWSRWKHLRFRAPSGGARL